MGEQRAQVSNDTASKQADSSPVSKVQRPLSGLPENYLFENFERPRISSLNRLGIQTKLSIGPANDKYEQEADRVAEQVMRFSYNKKTGGVPSNTAASNLSPGKDTPAPSISDSSMQTHTIGLPSRNYVTPTSGQELSSELSQQFNLSTGVELPPTRLHFGAKARRLTQLAQARAVTSGSDVYFGTDSASLGSVDGRRLLFHELAHVAQNSREGSRLAGRLFRDADDAYYPTEEGQREIDRLLNPQNAAGAEVDPVDDPALFRQEMLTRFTELLGRILPAARARESSGIRVARNGMEEVADIAEREVLSEYGSYINAVPTAATRQPLRDTFQEIPTTVTPETQNAILHWVESRMLVGTNITNQHNVVSGTIGECGDSLPSAGWPSECRDRQLFVHTRNEIITANQSDLETLILNYPGWEYEGVSYIQSRVPGQEDIAEERLIARTRWKILHTMIHEMLHTTTHSDFEDAINNVEEDRASIEGFTEYFTIPVYTKVRDRALNSNNPLDTTRMDVEGALVSPFEIPEYNGTSGSYANAVSMVRDIRTHTNEDGLRSAYFLGQVEYLGLGNWTASEARRHHPANMIGVGLLLQPMGDSSQLWLRADYVRVLLGSDGQHQLQLQADVAVTTSGDRLAGGVGLFYEVHTDHFFFRPGLSVVGSGAADFSADTGRLDFVPSMGIGARFANFRVGADAQLLLPVATGDPNPALGGRAAPQGVSGLVGLGLSYEF